MTSEPLTSIELALGALGLVLGLRLTSMLRVGRELPSAEARVSKAAESGDAVALAKHLKRFGYRLPFQVVASDLVFSLGEPDAAKRAIQLTKTSRLLETRISRHTNRGQALDLLTLSLMVGVAAFSARTLPTTPLFWSLGGGLFALVVANFFARRVLSENVLSSLTRITALLQAQQIQTTLEREGEKCPFCGGPVSTETCTVTFDERASRLEERVLAHVCTKCDTVTFRKSSDGDASSSSWPVS